MMCVAEGVLAMTKSARLEQYWKYKGFDSGNAFAKHLGIHPDHVGPRLDKKQSIRTLEKRLRELCPDLNLIWFLTGEGEMLMDKNGMPELTNLFDEIRELYKKAETKSKSHLILSTLYGKVEELKKEGH